MTTETRPISGLPTTETALENGDWFIIDRAGVPSRITAQNVFGANGNLEGIKGLTFSNNEAPIYHTGAWQKYTVSSYIRSVLVASDAAAARTTLGAAAVADVSGGSTASATGSSVNFTGIPSGVTQIEIGFIGVVLSGTGGLNVQLGDSGGVETSGYVSTAVLTSGSTLNETAGFPIIGATSPDAIHGAMILTLGNASTNAWLASHNARISNTVVSHGGGSKALSAMLDRVTIVPRGGPVTFNAGTITMRWRY